MVLLHGIGGSHINWMLVAPALAERFHVYAVDQIGFGFTPVGRRDCKFVTQARYVDRFIAEVAGGPAVVLGHSMGGVIGMLVAARHPAAVARLIPIDPAACRIRGNAPGLPTWLMLALAAYPQLGGHLAGVMARSQGVEALVNKALGRAFGPGNEIDPALLAAHVDVEKRRAIMPVPYRGYIEGWASMRGTHAERPAFLTDVVSRIEAPTLLVRGTLDPLISQHWFERLSEARPDWDNARLADVGHDPHMEAPHAFLEVIEPWLEGARRADPAGQPLGAPTSAS